MVEMLGGRKVPSDFYVLVKLVSQLSSLYSTDIREALVIQSEETQNSKTVCLRISRRRDPISCCAASQNEWTVRWGIPAKGVIMFP